MRALLTITWTDLRIFFSRPGNWIGLVVVPVALTLVLGFAFSGSSEPQPLRVDVINEDEGSLSARLVDALRRNDALVVCLSGSGEADVEEDCDLADQPLTVETGVARVREGDSAALIVIPAGYTAAVETSEPVEIAYYSTADLAETDPVRQSLDAVVQQVNSAMLTAAVAGAILERAGAQGSANAASPLWRDAVIQDVYAQTERLLADRPAMIQMTLTRGETTARKEGFGQAVPGIGSMQVLFTVLGGMAFLQRDRQRWTLQRLGVMPLRRSQILGSKILTYFTMGMVQYLLIFAIGLVVGLDFGPRPLLLGLVMAAFVLCSTGLTFAIAPLLTSERQASVVAQLLGITFAALGGAWWPLEIVPPFMQQVGHLSPVAWAMDAFHDLIFYSGGLIDILPEIGVLLAATALLFGFGIWRFRYV